MSIEGVNIRRGNLGANVLAGADSTSGMVLQGVAAPGLALNAVAEIRQLKDAEALGITDTYDSDNNVRVWYHIKEFYRLAGRGTRLYILLVATSVSMADMADTANDHAKKLVVESQGEVRQLGLVANPQSGYSATIVDGMDSNVLAAIPQAKGLVDWSWQTHRPLVVLIEGRELTGLAAAVQDLRDITNTPAQGVGVVIAQDFNFAETQNTLGRKHAAVGTALGAMAAIAVAQNIGEVETLNLSDTVSGSFLNPGLSSHAQVSDVEDELATLDAKGYIFPLRYTGQDGVYFNSDHACVEVIQDSEGNYNHYQLSYSRTVGKAARQLRQALLPKVKSVQRIDPSSGKLEPGVVKYFDGLGNDALLAMEAAGEISGGATYTDPDSNLLTPPRELKVDFAIVPMGTIDTVAGNVNLKRSI